jgi:SAM-dependent methyltransferase
VWALEDDLAHYYEERAGEYDGVYEKPERQEDLAYVKAVLRRVFRNRSVLEVAAGTGYWTAVIAPVATRVVATDINEGPLQVARMRDYGGAAVDFQRADAFALDNVSGDFDALFAGFWWSHLPLNRVSDFLRGMARRLPAGSLVVAIDNCYVEGSSSPIVKTDAAGNTYQRRVLKDGRAWEILKNFPTPDALRQSVAPFARHATVECLTYYWLLTFELA